MDLGDFASFFGLFTLTQALYRQAAPEQSRSLLRTLGDYHKIARLKHE
jgi:hypothetical protein